MLQDGWLFGARACPADIAIQPFVRQFAHTDTQWLADQRWPRLLAWLAGFEAGTLYFDVMKNDSPGGKHNKPDILMLFN